MPRSARPLLLVCFLLSGAASLMDQVVWLRYLALSFGNTTWAAATLLGVFMGGLGLGAMVAGRLAYRFRRPLIVYALVEILIALIALASPDGLEIVDAGYVWLYRTWGSQPALFAVGRALLATLFLLPPTFLMGSTLPLILRAVTEHREQVGRESGLFYGMNTLGATLGTIAAGFVTVRLIGLFGTLAIAGGLNLLAALGALLVSRATATTTPTAKGRRPPAWLLTVIFGMGATSLGYEVLWTRVLVFFLGSSVYAYSLMLALVLIGIGLGSLLVAPWADRTRSPLTALAAVEIGIAIWIPIQVLLFEQLNSLLVSTARALHASSFAGLSAAQLLAVLPLLLPPTLLMGISFPLALKAVNRDIDDLAVDVGAVYGINTLGAVVGALGAGFVLIPLVGTQNALFVLATGNALLGAWLLARAERRAWRWFAIGAPAALALVAVTLPPHLVILSAGMFRHDMAEDLVYFHEDAQASVTIRRLDGARGPYLSLELNGVNVAGTSPDLYAIQKMQGHLPMLLGSGASSVVHIGFGSGGTAWAVSRHPVDDVLIVEISPEVLAASNRFFGNINHGVLDDPRVRWEINDGRNFLLASPERFDAVLSDSIHPRYAGNGSLYSLEYFRLARERLRPGGVVSMWLPMYSITPRNFAMILKAFQQVFPHVAVWYEPSALNSFTIVTGKVDDPVLDAGQLDRAFANERVANELADLGITGPADLLPLLLATDEELAPWLAQVPPHIDDLPSVEYESGSLLLRDHTWLATFTILLELRSHDPPAAYLDALPASTREEAAARYRDRRVLLHAHRDSLERQLRESFGR